MTQIQVPEKTLNEMTRIKMYYPYRIVFAVLIDDEWQVHASVTKAKMNNFARKGYTVATMQ